MPTPTGRIARPSKLTPALQEVICKLLRLGTPTTKVCDHVGIKLQTYNRWLRAGRRCEDEIYVLFEAATKKASAQFVTRNMALIRKAAPRTWTAAAWLLERTLPELFALRQSEQIAALAREIVELNERLGMRPGGHAQRIARGVTYQPHQTALPEPAPAQSPVS